MEYVNSTNIHKAIIHILDNNAAEPILYICNALMTCVTIWFGNW